MKYQKWNRSQGTAAGLLALTAAGVPPLAALVLAARGADTPQAARDFLSSDPAMLHDPFLLKDMDKAVSRVKAALAAEETIAIYGDYDVDGITATCLLTHCLTGLGGKVIPYIPDRLEEGYGLNREAVDALRARGVTLIITVDCGITAVEETEYARSLGVDMVITDHHECKTLLPKAVAVVDPHRPDCPYPFKSLAGVGVALKLAMAIAGTGAFAQYADLAAIGTVADVMQLTDENRALVRYGLDRLAKTTRPGLAALLREAGVDDKPLTAVTIGYTLAPRINAAGRMGCASLAAELLLTGDPDTAEELAHRLCALNRKRQQIEGVIYDRCVEALDRETGKDRAAIVLAGDDWHQGVVGIVASRLSERYSCPTFMICLQGGKGKGSCRSYGGFNLFAALQSCGGLLESFGGHELAAGFTILEENIPAFREKITGLVTSATGGEEMVSVLDIDAEIEDEALLTTDQVAALDILEPHGAGNPRPVFSLSGCTVLFVSEVGGGRHLKLKLRRGAATFDAIFFSMTAGRAQVSAGDRLDVAFSPQINEFRGNRTVQLQVCDLRPAPTRAQAERALFERFQRGEPLTAAEAAALTPSREEFASLWRYLKGRAPHSVDEHPTHLARNVARTFHLRETYMRTMVCVQVFHERGLIRVEQTSDRMRIVLNSVDGKVDLEQSHIMRKLRDLTDR